MDLSKRNIEELCNETFKELSVASDCTSIVQSIAHKNPSGASKMLEILLLKAISGCLYKVLEKSNS